MHQTRDEIIQALLTFAGRTAALNRVASRITSLKGKTRDVAQFLVQNVESLDELTIDEIAARCDTSRATILRTSNELGYDNFSQLRKELLAPADTEPAREPTDVFFKTMQQCIMMLLDTFSTADAARVDAAADLILSHQPIYVYGGAMSGGMARVLQNRFRWMGLPVYASSDVEGLVHEMRQGAGLLFCVSHLGATPNVLRVLTEAKRSGLPRILLVNLESAPACKEANVVLSTNITSLPTHGYDLLARTSQLFMVDVLCQEIEAKKSQRPRPD